tara:strand:+ start:22850 stop:23368 length:519 start_codon:yes stop_codon:yes gene_type:complete
MSAFQSDDYYNVIAEHVLETLQADSKLADAGALDVKTWEQELREDAGDFNSNELPAVSVTCDLSSVEDTGTQQFRRHFAVTVWIVTDGARMQNAAQTVKSFAARVERSMNQQEAETKQLSDVTADLLESISGSVQVTPVGTVIGGGPVEGNNLRGVAVLSFAVAVDFTVVID